jgi:hypothetical protein
MRKNQWFEKHFPFADKNFGDKDSIRPNKLIENLLGL